MSLSAPVPAPEPSHAFWDSAWRARVALPLVAVLFMLLLLWVRQLLTYMP